MLWARVSHVRPFLNHKLLEQTYVLDLVLVEGGYGVDNDPGQTAAKVDNLVHHEGHDAGGEGVILHEQIPRGPETLCHAELDMDLGHLLEDGEVVGWCCRVQPTSDCGVDRRERRAPVRVSNVSPVRGFGVSKIKGWFVLLYLHDGGHGEGVLLSESRIWVEPGQVRSRRDTVVFEEWSVYLCLSSTILNL